MNATKSTIVHTLGSEPILPDSRNGVRIHTVLDIDGKPGKGLNAE